MSWSVKSTDKDNTMTDLCCDDSMDNSNPCSVVAPVAVAMNMNVNCKGSSKTAQATNEKKTVSFWLQSSSSCSHSCSYKIPASRSAGSKVFPYMTSHSPTSAAATTTYKTEAAVLCSILKDGLLHKVNSTWRNTFFHFLSDGTLVFFRVTFFTGRQVEYARFDISNVSIHRIEVDDDLEDSMNGNIGIKVKCRDFNRIEAGFRVVFPNDLRVEQFLSAVASNAQVHNVDSVRGTISSQRLDHETITKGRNLFAKMSIMRSGIQRTLNKVEKRSVVEVVRAR
jgi:hypothetical protein